MYFPQDIVYVIIDQLVSVAVNDYHDYHLTWLQATSLVSTAWVNPSQRHLFSTINFYFSASVRKWCSRIRPGPYGISRYVRVLRLGAPSLHPDILETALPHLTSFQNLRELDMGQVSHGQRIHISRVFLDVLVPIFSSFAGALKRLQWTQKDAAHETWKTFYTLTDLLPNLTDIDLSGVRGDYNLPILPPALPRLCMSPGNQPPDPLAFKHFKFKELKIVDSIPPSPQFLEHCQTHLRVLDFWSSKYVNNSASKYQCKARTLVLTTLTDDLKNLQVLFEVCHALQEVSFPFKSSIGEVLGLIPSNSVTLVRLCEPDGIVGTTYNRCWGHSLSYFEACRNGLERFWIPEYEMLGVSIRKIAQRFSEHHCGLKTRVQVVYQPRETEAQAIDNGEIPFFMMKLEEELGTHVTLELDLLPSLPDAE